MVMDFSDVKTVVKKWIDDNLDHTMLLAAADPIIPMLEQTGEKFYVMKKNPTAENIAEHIYDFVESQDFPIVDITLWETDTSYARYSR
jgi:6-pyruvoyltetrahydropterin/6-carboxytetrahydropterin synthase